jgi:hypothetical protein
MKTKVVLEDMDTYSSYAPLAVLGYCLTRTDFLAPLWSELEMSVKKVTHSPVEKLQDLLVGILIGMEGINQINTQLRPDLTLAAAWNRMCFAEQSTIADLLDAFEPKQVNQLRQGYDTLFRCYSQTMRHDFERQWLMIDIDPTVLPASRRAAASSKCFSSRYGTAFGRQLARLNVPTYHETLYSWLYPGNQQAVTMLKPGVKLVQQTLNLSPQQRKRTIIRSDASIGTDGNINWLLWGKYQVLMKGFSANRANSLVKQLQPDAWIADAKRKRWIARAVDPPRFGRRINVFCLRWLNKKGIRHGTLLSTLFDLSPLSTLRAYDGRGAMEVEIRADKQGLNLTKRRKKRLPAQEALILMTDTAHNLLSWLHRWVLEGTSFDQFGTKRMVDELLCIPGRIELKGNQLYKVALRSSHPYAEEMRLILGNLLKWFDNP